ncbi:MAG: hypothetical protein ACI3YH_01310 [Eubacteriales bacterium]
MSYFEMVKKSTIYFLFLIILFVGCTPDNASNTNQIIENEKYTLVWEQGKCYLSIKSPDEYAPLDSQTHNSIMLDPSIIQFDSIREMKETIANGNFSESEMIQLANYFPKDDQGRVKVLNIDQLYCPVLPDGIADGGINWRGETYSCSLSSEIGVHGWFSYRTYESYSNIFQNNYTDFFESNELVHLVSTSNETERNATIYEFTTSLAELRKIRYCIETNDKILYIDETYALSVNHELLVPSETIPSSINIYGQMDEGYFYIYLSDFTERPSVEWLSSFGLIEYAEFDTAQVE